MCQGMVRALAPPAKMTRTAREDQASTRLRRIVRHRTGRAEVADVGANDSMPCLDDRELAGVDVGAQFRKLCEAIEHLALDLGFVFGETQGIELRRERPNRRRVSACRCRLPLPPPLFKLCVCRICLSFPEPAEEMHGLGEYYQSAVFSRQSSVGSLQSQSAVAVGSRCRQSQSPRGLVRAAAVLPPCQRQDDRHRHDRQHGDRRPQRETSDSSCHCLPPDFDEAPDTHRHLEMPEKLQTPRQSRGSWQLGTDRCRPRIAGRLPTADR